MTTERQQALLLFIDGFITDHGHAPTFEEMSDELGYKSKSTAHGIVARLIDRGYLRYEGSPGLQRSLVVVKVGLDRFDGIATADLRAELARRGEAV